MEGLFPVSNFPTDGQTSTYVDGNGEVLGTGFWHYEFIDKKHFDAGNNYDGPEIWDELDSSLIARKRDALAFNWNKIGQRIGLSRDQTQLMKARAAGVTRAAMGQHLKWKPQKAERIWKAVQRLFDKPDMAEKVRQALCSHSSATKPARSSAALHKNIFDMLSPNSQSRTRLK